MSPESVYKPVEKLGVGDNRPLEFGQMFEKSVSSHYGATVGRIFDPFSDFVRYRKPTSDFCHGDQGSPQLFPKFGENEKKFGCSFFENYANFWAPVHKLKFSRSEDVICAVSGLRASAPHQK